MLGKSKSAKFLRMALSATSLALVAVLFSAFLRSSEAGLGCPEWPGCYGKLFAPLTAQDIELARQMEGAPASEGPRVWKETTQRGIAVSLTFVLIRLTVLGWELKKRRRSQQVLIPLTTMLCVVSLSVLGFVTFDYRYKPLVQLAQFLGAMLVLMLLWWIVMREQRFWRSVNSSPRTNAIRLRAIVAIVLVAFQITLGGWSAVNYAALACPDYPTCQGSLWPAMDFTDAFTLWQNVGIEYEGRLLNLEGATAIHVAHRLGALVALLYVGWLALHLLRVGRDDNIRRYGLLILVILLTTIGVGAYQSLAHLPVAGAVAHSGLAALSLMSLVTLYHVVRPPRYG
jgi:heme a synthase